MMVTQQKTLYNFQFIILCLSFALFGSSFNMIIPEMPEFLSNLGGAEYKGFIISLFTLTAGFSRPFSGKLTDKIGRMPVIFTGAVVCIICSLIYPILSGVSGFMMLRLCHGFSTGFTPTAITAYVADIAPIERRGEAMGIIGVSINIGASIAPPVGSFIANNYSMNTMFYCSSLTALLSVLLLTNMKETLKNKERFSLDMLKLSKDEIIDRQSLIPAVLSGLTYMGLGVILTIVADQSVHLGISNKGLFFTSFTMCSILSRLVAGKVSDQFSRITVIKVGFVCLAIAYVLMAMTDSQLWLLCSSGAIGFSMGIVAPALFAWTIDRTSEDRRGKAMATIYIGLEIAIGFGALVSAAIYDNTPDNFDLAFGAMAIITLLALPILLREGSESN